MQLRAGQTVVHPHHGPATVASFMTRRVQGEKRKYATLHVIGSTLEVSVPVDMVSEVGVREPMSTAQLRTVFKVLVAKSGPLDKTWSRRFKAQTALYHSGDMQNIATVVRDIARRQEDSGISAGEKSLLRSATAPIVTELTVCLGLDEEEASAAITAAVLEGTIPELDRTLATAS